MTRRAPSHFVDKMVRMLSVREVARLYDTEDDTVLEWAEKGIIPAPDLIGGLVRWHESFLAFWQANGHWTSESLSAEEFACLLEAHRKERSDDQEKLSKDEQEALDSEPDAPWQHGGADEELNEEPPA